MSLEGGTPSVTGPTNQRAAPTAAAGRASAASTGDCAGFAGLLMGLGDGTAAPEDQAVISQEDATRKESQAEVGAAQAPASDNPGAAQAFLAQWLSPGIGAAGGAASSGATIDAGQVTAAVSRLHAGAVSTAGANSSGAKGQPQDGQLVAALTAGGDASRSPDSSGANGLSPIGLHAARSQQPALALAADVVPGMTSATDAQTLSRVAQAGSLQALDKGLRPDSAGKGGGALSQTLGRINSVGSSSSRSGSPLDAVRLWPAAVDSAPSLTPVVTSVEESSASTQDRNRSISTGKGGGTSDVQVALPGSQPGFTSTPSDGNGLGAASSNASVQTAVAQQVKSWITHDIRSAELKLDGLGVSAVMVNISLSGNEAHVVFRSDQAHTRELLGSAMGQLDQLLRDQGMTLGGAWVGSSASQGHPGASPQAARSGTVRMAIEPLTPQGQPAPTRVSDRVLDLFV